jgi:hypothetical protein
MHISPTAGGASGQPFSAAAAPPGASVIVGSSGTGVCASFVPLVPAAGIGMAPGTSVPVPPLPEAPLGAGSSALPPESDPQEALLEMSTSATSEHVVSEVGRCARSLFMRA